MTQGMKMRLAVWALGLLLAGGASTRAETIVVIDNWWSTDFACLDHAASCEQEVLNYVYELTAQMAASPQCAGVSVVTGEGPRKLLPSQALNDAVGKPHWTLMIDFISGKHEQGWTMVHSVNVSLAQGEAAPKELAKTVCAIVTGQGEKILR
jgi:hypothetical protein